MRVKESENETAKKRILVSGEMVEATIWVCLGELQKAGGGCRDGIFDGPLTFDCLGCQGETTQRMVEP